MQNWEKLREITAYKGYRSILKKTFLLPNQREADYDIVDNFSFVSIAAITKAQEVILIEQYRPGPEKMLVSFPEGQIDKFESAETTAKRELLEETGYQVGKLEFIREVAQAYSQSRKYIFIATDCEKIQEPRLDDSEFIRVFTMSLAEFRLFLKDRTVQHFTSTEDGYLLLDYLGGL